VNEAEAAVGRGAGFDPDVGVAYRSYGDGALTVVGEEGNKYEVWYVARRWGGRHVVRTKVARRTPCEGAWDGSARTVR
jgi:hypothetical protein